jgi:hypothetical protein
VDGAVTVHHSRSDVVEVSAVEGSLVEHSMIITADCVLSNSQLNHLY